MAQVGGIMTNFVRFQAKGQVWSNSCQFWALAGRISPNSAEFGSELDEDGCQQRRFVFLARKQLAVAASGHSQRWTRDLRRQLLGYTGAGGIDRAPLCPRSTLFPHRPYVTANGVPLDCSNAARTTITCRQRASPRRSRAGHMPLSAARAPPI